MSTRLLLSEGEMDFVTKAVECMCSELHTERRLGLRKVEEVSWAEEFLEKLKRTRKMTQL